MWKVEAVSLVNRGERQGYSPVLELRWSFIVLTKKCVTRRGNPTNAGLGETELVQWLKSLWMWGPEGLQTLTFEQNPREKSQVQR